jgi:hypothetical protein
MSAMGQRSAIIMFLWGGGIVVPLVALVIIAESLGRSTLPVAVLAQVVGFACLVFAKWPELAAGRLFSFGPKGLSVRGRKFYWSGYTLIGCGIVLALASLAYRYPYAA